MKEYEFEFAINNCPCSHNSLPDLISGTDYSDGSFFKKGDRLYFSLTRKGNRLSEALDGILIDLEQLGLNIGCIVANTAY